MTTTKACPHHCAAQWQQKRGNEHPRHNLAAPYATTNPFQPHFVQETELEAVISPLPPYLSSTGATTRPMQPHPIPPPLRTTCTPAAVPDLISSILKDSRCCTQPASVCLEFQKMLDERREGKKTSSENIT
ncbi:hypothetical protein BDZ97DRAFT_2055611 [Flammula alnicola]|nr:hypothetical protein BDZ97DRAFT_1764190 [Flammula alnicola]KAF8969959.1 hypothetical protein BDZ97DRAFT_2055611 [Flammula alnicola]